MIPNKPNLIANVPPEYENLGTFLKSFLSNQAKCNNSKQEVSFFQCNKSKFKHTSLEWLDNNKKYCDINIHTFYKILSFTATPWPLVPNIIPR